MTRRRTRHGIGHRIGNWCCWAIWWLCIAGIPIVSSRGH